MLVYRSVDLFVSGEYIQNQASRPTKRLKGLREIHQNVSSTKIKQLSM